VKLSREVFSQKAFDEFRDVEILPGPDTQTDEEIDEYARNNVETEYHPSCTCKMGDTSNDNMAVVDNEAKVVGIDNLRVVDASIMPIMMAERISDKIKGVEMLPAANAPVWKPQSLETRRQGFV